MCVSWIPGAEGQNMLGRVEQRRDGASRLGKGGRRGAMELKNQDNSTPRG